MKVLINRTDAIGDTILTLPMARMIKEHHPDAEVGFLISKRVEDVFLNQPDVDHVWCLDSKWTGIKKYFFSRKVFKEFKPNFYFFVGGSHYPTLLAYLRRVKFRGGLISKWQNYLFLNRGVRQSRSMVVMHETDYNLELLKPLGIQNTTAKKSELAKNLIQINMDELAQAKIWLSEELEKSQISDEGPLIFVHPGMTGHTLNWSSRNYGRLITRLFEKLNGKVRFVVSYTPSDNRFLTGLKDQLSREEYSEVKKRVYFFNGISNGLRHYMSCLRLANLYIGPSTGPTHLANVMGVPTVAIYSPIKVQSSMRWGPLVKDKDLTRMIVPDVVCGEQFNCVGDVCPYYECMAKIEVDEVAREALELLEINKNKKIETGRPIERDEKVEGNHEHNS